jgi:hypothetical protein
MINLKSRVVRLTGLALVLASSSIGSAAYLRAQTEIQPSGCEFRTRWKDAFGDCPSCCDAREFACPCTV